MCEQDCEPRENCEHNNHPGDCEPCYKEYVQYFRDENQWDDEKETESE